MDNGTYKVLEVSHPSPAANLDDESLAAIANLAGHPGYQALMGRLALQRSYLETKLKREKHATIREVDILQQGIFWLDWMQKQVTTASKTLQEEALQPRAAMQVELDEFARIQGALEIIGRTQ